MKELQKIALILSIILFFVNIVIYYNMYNDIVTGLVKNEDYGFEEVAYSFKLHILLYINLFALTLNFVTNLIKQDINKKILFTTYIFIIINLILFIFVRLGAFNYFFSN